jgi:hypothetical protein
MKAFFVLVLMLSSMIAEGYLSPLYNSANQLQGRNISAGAPSNGQVLGWNSTSSLWLPVTGGGGGGGDVNDGGNAYGAGMVLGTTDNFGLNLITNSLTRMYLLNDGQIGFGTSPDAGNAYQFYTAGNGAASSAGIFSDNVLSDTTNGANPQMGLYATVHSDHNSGTYALLRNYLSAETDGNGPITEMYGARAISRVFDKNAPSNVSSAIVSNVYGLEAYANNTSTNGVIRNSTGLWISSSRATGADSGQTHVAKGIYISNTVLASGGTTNLAYAIDSDSTAPSILTGDLQMRNAANFYLYNSDSSKSVGLQVGSLAASLMFTLPTTYGNSGDCIKGNGAGVLSFGSCGGGGTAVNFGGNANGADSTIGLTDAYKLSFLTNNTARMNIASTGEVTVGGNPGDLGEDPIVFGAYKFDTADSNRAFDEFDNYFSYYGSSSNSRDGTTFSLTLRPGDPSFTYSGEYNALNAKAYVGQPGLVTSMAGLKTQVAVTNGSGVAGIAIGNEVSVSAPSGVMRNAYGVQIQTVQAGGSDGSPHTAIGLDIASDGSGVVAAGSSISNIAIGLRIANSVTATDTNPSVFAIQSNSTAPSTFAGGLQLSQTTTRPTCSSATRGMMWVTQGGSGVADLFSVCLKNVLDAYAWVDK